MNKIPFTKVKFKKTIPSSSLKIEIWSRKQCNCIKTEETNDRKEKALKIQGSPKRQTVIAYRNARNW